MRGEATLGHIASRLVAGAMLAVRGRPEQAAPARLGCNLVDEHSVSTDFAGQAIWLSSGRYIVNVLDVVNEWVICTCANGTPYQSAEDSLCRRRPCGRNGNVARLAVAVCGLRCPGGSGELGPPVKPSQLLDALPRRNR